MSDTSAFSGVSQGYVSGAPKEAARLHVQEFFGRTLDAKLLDRAYSMLGRREGLTALDVGCADGNLTQRRLTAKNGFSRTVGVDYNTEALEWAEKRRKQGFSYYQADVESGAFLDRMREIMDREGIASFDVIYSALTIHHLKDQQGALRKLNALLAPDGALLLRGVDDGGQLFFLRDRETGEADVENSMLVEELTRLSVETPGMSNRYHGRQLYSWLRQAGFREIYSEYDVADTVGKSAEDRKAIYEYDLAFRSNYTWRALERDPNNEELKRRHLEMIEKLDKIKNILISRDDVYYMVVAFGMAARKY